MPSEEERKIRHLEMIQGVVSRLASNSFSIRRWSTVLVAALVVAAFTADAPEVAFIGSAAVIGHWLLDSYYLWQERRFRGLYDQVRGLDPEDVDFAMRTPPAPFWPVVFSVTECLFYSVLILATLAAGVILVSMTRSADAGPACCSVPW